MYSQLGVHDVTQRNDGCVRRHGVTRVVSHPSFNSLTFDNDISLLELDSEAEYAPISSLQQGTAAPGSPLRVAGWGTTSFEGASSDLPLDVTIPLVAQARPQRSTDRQQSFHVSTIHVQQLSKCVSEEQLAGSCAIVET